MNIKGLDIQKGKIAVIGFGISGKSAARYFLRHGIDVDVFEDKPEEAVDQATIAEYISNDKFKIYFAASAPDPDMQSYDYVIASPGVRLQHPLVVKARENGIDTITDINTFLRIFRASYPAGKVVSITGSNGKSTTVSLMHHALKATEADVYLGGNIGTSPLDFFDEIKTDTPVVILETSSYQLEYLSEKDYFDIAGITNISDNHLDRYQCKKELYVKAKLGGINPDHTDVIINLDDADTQKYVVPNLPSKHVLGVQFESGFATSVITLENDSIVYKTDDDQIQIVPDINKMNIKGLHNAYNAAFVAGVLVLLGIEPTAKFQEAVYEFAGLIHRTQIVDVIGGVAYINDSKSTSPDATVKALDAIGIGKNIILISGGNDKDISYDAMSEGWENFVKQLILLPGSANPKLKVLAERTGVELLGEVGTMQEAIDVASAAVQSGDTVLLSPATGSHASFKSFEDRGNQFIECIKNSKI